MEVHAEFARGGVHSGCSFAAMVHSSDVHAGSSIAAMVHAEFASGGVQGGCFMQSLQVESVHAVWKLWHLKGCFMQSLLE